MKTSLLSLYFLTLSVFFMSVSYAQENDREFGDVKPSDFTLPESFENTEHGAVVLFDYGLTTLDHTFSVVLNVHTRILILDKSEYDRASVKIKYNKEGYVEKIKAKSYQLRAGKVVESKLSRRDIYTEEVSEDVRSENFTIPNVVEGTIIEYRYKVATGNIYSLNTWYFQTDIPTVLSKYEVDMINEFNYKQRLSGSHKLAYTDFQKSTKVISGNTYLSTKKTFVAKDVPAFKEEPYMTHERNHIAKIKFDLSDYQIPGQYVERVMPDNFLVYSAGVADRAMYKAMYKNNNYMIDDLKRILSPAMTDLEECKAIYTFVQDEFEVDNEEMSEILRHIYNSRKGWTSDINKVLVSMLANAGFDAYIMKVSTRDHGYVDPLYPAPATFNYEVCVVKMNGKNIFLDASKDYLPFGILPAFAVNQLGLLISKEQPALVEVNYEQPKTTSIYAKLDFNEEGYLEGDMQIRNNGYAAYFINKKYELDDALYVKEQTNNVLNWDISSYEIEHTGYEQITDNITLKSESSISDKDIFIFNPNILFKLDENPFPAEERLHPVALDVPEMKRASFSFSIPEGYEVSEMPESVMVALPNNLGKFMYSVNRLGSTISINSILEINEVNFTPEGYFYLKELYARIVEKHAESIIFEKVL